eukprot:g1532.t1
MSIHGMPRGSSQDLRGMGLADEKLYADEGAALLRKLNLEAGSAGGKYEDLNCVYRDPATGGGVFIGNIGAASKKEILDAHGITNVVNCQGKESKNYFEKTGEVAYYRFPVSFWRSKVGYGSAVAVVEYFQPVFDWIDAAVAQGNGVLIHCLAGAHRAGTTGVAYIMHAGGVRLDVALATAKRLRPIVNPFAGLLEALQNLDEAMAKGEWAGRVGGGGGAAIAGASAAGSSAAAGTEQKG